MAPFLARATWTTGRWMAAGTLSCTTGFPTRTGITPLEFLQNMDVLYFILRERILKGLGRNARNWWTSISFIKIWVRPCDGSGRRRGLVVTPKALEAERKRNMKTYCKGLIVADAANIEKSITEYFSNKHKKNSTIKFVSDYTMYEREYVRENFKPGKE